MNRKLIFLDIDGTLTEPGSNVPPVSAVRAIRKAREKGNPVFLCTGRNFGMLRPVLEYGFDGVVASSGGYIRCGDNVIYDCPLTEEIKHKIFATLKGKGIYRTVECLDGAYTDEALKDFLMKNAHEGSNSEMLRWRRHIEESLHIRPMAEYQNQPVYKVIAMCKDQKILEQAKICLGDELNFCIQEPDRFGYVTAEIISREFDKGTGIRKVCDHLGISPAHTIAFGDSINDVEMMEAVALGICMENGSARLKELADEICPAVEKDGLYLAFEKHHLI